MTNRRVNLRHNMEKVIDAFGYNLGGVTLPFLMYHVNNTEKFKDTGFSEEEILLELEYMESIGKIEKVPSWIIHDDGKCKGEKR